MRKFYKISFEEFQKYYGNDKSLYNSYNIPKRSTRYSAGYDFESIIDFTLKPGEMKKIALGIKVDMNQDEMLLLVVRSSMGFKYNVRLTNQIGVFESDYFNNPQNEGHMFVSLQNHGEQDWIVHKGDKICQGIFTKFLVVDDEEEITDIRVGGIGSTGKGENENE